MEITKREILFSTVIVAIMMMLGIVISRPILNHALHKSLRISSSVQVDDSSKFDYIGRTDVGDFIAEGIITTINPVSIEDIEGKYSKIMKVKEEYRKHTKEVTETDSNGKTYTRTRTYWSWDVMRREIWEADSISFYGKRFSYRDISYSPYATYLKTIEPKRKLFQNKIRYKYYVATTSEHGCIMGVVSDKTYSDMNFMKDITLNKVIERSENNINNGPIGFWIFWTLLTIGAVMGFCSMDNKWLY